MENESNVRQQTTIAELCFRLYRYRLEYGDLPVLLLPDDIPGYVSDIRKISVQTDQGGRYVVLEC